GANAAALSDVDALTASDSAVIAAIGSQTIVAVGFEQIDATGTGSATASIYGTRKNDAFVSNAQSATMNYGTGATLNVNGFSSIAVDGRGGEDSAVLIAGRGANAFEGFADSATLTNGSFKRALANFSNVTAMGQDDDSIKSTLVATLHDTALDDAFAAYGDTATMDVEGANLYTVIAADQVSVKRDIAKGADTVDEALDLDFVFSVENWED
ncbi:MAG: hypothetical protein II622_00825, partial [Thermoguttaceae bacterium]|nr:hypothetical protein [Thermoguttaceae bacterium]